MKIDYTVLKDAFRIDNKNESTVWAYAECYDAVRIGTWNGSNLCFYDSPIDDDLIQLLRVFNEKREIRFSENAVRDTDMYTGELYKDCDFITDTDLTNAKYIMYGENSITEGNYTKLWEKRGGAIYFPAKLEFPNNKVELKLGIKNYIRYNPVSVCPKGEKYDFGLDKSGAGPIEVFDYAYTGFYYAGGGAVKV